jgi:hypothetical protein
MRFGQSVFQSVLDRLDAEETEAGEGDGPHRIQGLNASFAASVREGISAAALRPDQAYLDNLEPERPAVAVEPPAEPQSSEAPQPAPPVMPLHLLRTAPHDVAAELAISPGDSMQSLKDKRRAFAKANHPDGVPAAFRDNATVRMTIANLLIDEALRRLSRGK